MGYWKVVLQLVNEDIYKVIIELIGKLKWQKNLLFRYI